MSTAVEKIPLTPDAGEGLYWEARVADAWGVPRKVLARARTKELTEGDDFVRRENNAVALTAAGLAKVEAVVRADGTEGDRPGKPRKTGGKPASMKKFEVPAGPPPREQMTVERVAPMNPQLLLCVAHQRTSPVMVAVRVRDNANFAAGMVLEAIESGDGVWQFRNRVPGDESTVGRLPRRKGVW